MAKNSKQLSLAEVQEGADKLELEDQLALYYHIKGVIDNKQQYIADQLSKINEVKNKMNGN